MTTLLAPTKAEVRQQQRKEAKRQKEIEAIKAQPHLESLTITIEWKKSRTWGRNPHATGVALTLDGRRLEGHAKASGCGYCKTSTVIGDLFDQFLRHKLFGFVQARAVFSEVVMGEAPKLPTGICIPNPDQNWLPYFGRGYGVGCFARISEAIGGKWENISYTNNTEVYRWTATTAEDAFSPDQKV